MAHRGGSRRPGGQSRRRLLAILITLILLAMIAGLAAGLAASLGHLKHGPVGGGTRPSWQVPHSPRTRRPRGPAIQRHFLRHGRPHHPGPVPRRRRPGQLLPGPGKRHRLGRAARAPSPYPCPAATCQRAQEPAVNHRHDDRGLQPRQRDHRNRRPVPAARHPWLLHRQRDYLHDHRSRCPARGRSRKRAGFRQARAGARRTPQAAPGSPR